MKKIPKLKRQPRVFNAKASWQEVGGKRIYFRSVWEWQYALYLEFLKQNGKIEDWEHEPKTFWFEEVKRGRNNYKPDFRVLKAQGDHFWVEVKGFMDKGSIVKLKRFKQCFPAEEIEVVGPDWFQKHSVLLSIIKQMNISKRGKDAEDKII
jgi:hypothetical protein